MTPDASGRGFAATVWYVHGAGATDRSFRWLAAQLPPHRARSFSYDVGEGLGRCVERLGDEIMACGEPALVVGHSMGGVIAGGVAHLGPVRGLATLCAPFGGVAGIGVLALLRPEPLIRDLVPGNAALRAVRDGLSRSATPHLAIIGTSGLPFHRQPNDGVLTVDSQTALPGASFKALALNHFEVLLSRAAVDLIAAFGRACGMAGFDA